MIRFMDNKKRFEGIHGKCTKPNSNVNRSSCSQILNEFSRNFQFLRGVLLDDAIWCVVLILLSSQFGQVNGRLTSLMRNQPNKLFPLCIHKNYVVSRFQFLDSFIRFKLEFYENDNEIYGNISNEMNNVLLLRSID